LVLDFLIVDSNLLAEMDFKPSTIKQSASDENQKKFLELLSNIGVRKVISDYNFLEFNGRTQI
jgi:hypothetical protein